MLLRDFQGKVSPEAGKEAFAALSLLKESYPFCNKATALFLDFKNKEAVDQANKALNIDKSNIHAIYVRGRANLRLGNFGEALKDFSAVREANPDYLYLNWNIGNAYYNLRKYAEALKYYEDESLVNSTPDFFAARGNCFLQLKKYGEALQDYDRAFGSGYSNPAIIAQRGYAHLMLGNYGKAAQDYEQAIAKGKDIPGNLHNLGYAYLKLGKNKEATEFFLKSMKKRSEEQNKPADNSEVKELINFGLCLDIPIEGWHYVLVEFRDYYIASAKKRKTDTSEEEKIMREFAELSLMASKLAMGIRDFQFIEQVERRLEKICDSPLIDVKMIADKVEKIAESLGDIRRLHGLNFDIPDKFKEIVDKPERFEPPIERPF